jgi:hypothetical protein
VCENSYVESSVGKMDPVTKNPMALDSKHRFIYRGFGRFSAWARSAEEKKLKATYIWQMATKWGRSVLLKTNICFNYFLWRFCAFFNKASSKTPNFFFWGEPCQKPLAEKVEKKNLFPVVCSHRFCLSRFLPYLCMRSPKTP